MKSLKKERKKIFSLSSLIYKGTGNFKIKITFCKNIKKIMKTFKI